MGFFDSTSDSKTSSASGTAGAQTEQGNPSSINISPGGGLKGTVNLQVNQQVVSDPLVALTDNISGLAESLGSKSINAGFDLSGDAINLARDSLDAGERNIDSSFSFATDVLNDSARFRDAAVENQTRFTEEAFKFAGDRASDLKGVATDAIIANSNLSEDVLNKVFAAQDQFVGAVKDISARESTNDAGRIEAVTNKALTGAVVVVGLAIVGFVFMARR